ncbi:MAG: ribonuclease HII [Candidatus Levybacteria bacterium]|nr:ribonuclease HII [Candidatus Levybacteria bacterium]
MKLKPSFDEEVVLWNRGLEYVAGIDEVGRGAFAGPLVTAAVIFPKDCRFSDQELYGINDSKLLTSKKRFQLARKIKKEALSFSIYEIPVSYINRYGIGRAAQYGFFNVVQSLDRKPDFCLIDAFSIRKMRKQMQKPIIHGDSLSFSIAAASIIAKVFRDYRMDELGFRYNQYNFSQNKGYGTADHRRALGKYGLCNMHRKSFNLSRYLPVPPILDKV